MRHLKKDNANQDGFTLVEIVVATTLFAFTMVAMTTLFNYTLKINRKAEALRQATQGMRDFVEVLVKEIRNGQLDYGVVSGQSVVLSAVGPCPTPATTPLGQNPIVTPVKSTYRFVENRLGLLDIDGNRECFYLADGSGGYVGTGANSGKQIMLMKSNISQAESLTPLNNFTVEYLAFYIRPICDPYVSNCQDYGNKAAKIQPMVTIVAKFIASFPTGEQVPIYYQTSVSGDKYDIPNSP